MKFFSLFLIFMIVASSISLERNEIVPLYDKNDAAHFKYYENESHLINWYEWWYANLKNNDEGVIAFFFTFGNLNTFSRLVGVFISYLNESESIEAIICHPFLPFHLDYEKCNVSIAGNRFYEENGKFFIEFYGRNLKLRMEMEAYGKRYGSEAKIKDWQWAGWYVATPYGVGRAWIEYKGKRKYVEGAAYHDHNWGFSKMHRFSWDWGEFNVANKYAIIYGIAGIDDEMRGGVHFVNNSSHIFIPYDKINVEYLEWRKIGWAEKPVKIHLYGGNKSLSIDFYVELHRAYILGYKNEGKPYLLGKASGRIWVNGKEMDFESIGFYEHHGFI